MISTFAMHHFDATTHFAVLIATFYSGVDIVEFIVIKADDMFAVYQYADGLNMGSFSTVDVDNKGLLHISG